MRQVLPDLAILGISQRQPTTVEELAQARGVDERHRRGRIGREIVAAVAAGKAAEPPPVPDAVDELDRSKRPAVTLVSAWVSQVARDARIDTALLATRADLVAIIRGDPDARLAHGWRAELVGDGLTRLMEGHAGLTFDGKGSPAPHRRLNRVRLRAGHRARRPVSAGQDRARAACATAGRRRRRRRRRGRRRRGSGGAHRAPG